MPSRDERGTPFVPVNCAGLTESLLESELFGHVKGSFTGAYRDKLGKLQAAHGGTIFLDEVGEMSLRMQAMLLRFLENGEIQAVGSDRRQATVNVRVIAATNRNLPDLIAAGQFREDLLYRLRVIHLEVPPLRERRDEIPVLVTHFVARTHRRASFTDGGDAGARVAIAGQAMCASCRTSSSRRCGWRVATSSTSRSCRRCFASRRSRFARRESGERRWPTNCTPRW